MVEENEALEQWWTLRIHLIEDDEKVREQIKFSFPHICLIRGMEKQKDEKLFYLIEKKNKMMKNAICKKINLLSYPY